MKKSLFKVMALVFAATLILSGCTTSKPDATGSGETGTEITDLVYPRVAIYEMEKFNVLSAQDNKDSQNITNLVDPLLTQDNYGKLIPAIAEDWGTEDGGLTWTFKIRKGVQWVDVNGNPKAETTAQDFATGLEWVLNFHKNNSANTSMPIEMIKGASEYYEYTKTLTAEEAYALTAGEGTKFRELVGLETPDDYTLIYRCITEKPYFDTLATYNCLYPMSAAMVEELGGVDNVKSMNNENMWYNGAYTMTSFIQGNEKVFTKNPLYWDTTSSLFNTVTVKMVDSLDVAYQLYQSGDLDYVQLSESALRTISSDPNNPYYKYLVPDVKAKFSYQIHFNFNKLFADGTPDTNWNTAAANTAFRQSWYYGLDLKPYYARTNMVNPMINENNFYTMNETIFNSEGVDYTELVRQELGLKEPDGVTMARLDPAKAAELKAQAKEELTALGVTFPVEIDIYVMASNQTSIDTLNILKQSFSDGLGDDYVKLNIKTYVSSVTKEVADPHLHSIIINGWGADYGDPQNYLAQEVYGADNAYFSANYTNANAVTEETPATKQLLEVYKEYTRLVAEADAITTDLDARYAAYAKAEAYLLDKAITIPASYQVFMSLTKVDNTSRINGMYGIQSEKFKNWKTNVDGYTTEQAEALQAEKEAKG